MAMKRTAIAREPRREIDRLGRWYRCWIRGERPHLRLGLLCNFPAAFFRSSFRQIKMLVGYARVRAGATKLFCVDRLFTHFILLPAIYLCSCPLHNIVTINTIENIDNEKKIYVKTFQTYFEVVTLSTRNPQNTRKCSGTFLGKFGMFCK